MSLTPIIKFQLGKGLITVLGAFLHDLIYTTLIFPLSSNIF